MIATIVNCIAVVLGSLLGHLFHEKVTERFRQVIYTGVGMVSLAIGIMMTLETTRILFVAMSIVIGGILGSWWKIEDGILRFGSLLERGTGRRRGRNGKISGTGTTEYPDVQSGIEDESVGSVRSGNKASPDETATPAAEEKTKQFAHGFLTASIIFCVGAMTIVGSFRAGAEGNYDLILTKSVMDGSMAVLLTAAMGIGVAFSTITILVYQGGLTLLAGVLRPYISDLVLSELSGTGGILIMIIGLNLLALKEIKTGNFLPALAIVLLLTLLEPPVLNLIESISIGA